MTSALSYGVALKVRSEDALAPLMNTVAQPVLLLSGILLPLAFGAGVAASGRQVEPVLLGGRRHPGAVRRRPRRRRGVAGPLIVGVLALLAVLWAAPVVRPDRAVRPGGRG